MLNKIVLSTIIIMLGVSSSFAYSQEMSHSTFQETAQVIVDKSISQNVTASITLQSTSIQEIKISAELEKEVREDARIKSIVFTNQNECILGVIDESCIMINVIRNPDDKGIIAIQESSKEISQIYIDRVNELFDTDAKFHSVFIHTDTELKKALDTSGSVSGKGIISAVYTLPMEDTDSMYEKISAILIPKIIRDGGGFYDVAKNLSKDENSKMTFSWIPSETRSLLQLKLLVDYPNAASNISKVSPLEFLQTESLTRSNYFSSGFYPLNSIIQVIVLSSEETNVSEIQGDILPTQIIENEKIPTDISNQGWIFDPEVGQKIQGKYIFGKETNVDAKELEFSLGGKELQIEKQETDESIIVVAIISIVAILAALFYLKGYKK